VVVPLVPISCWHRYRFSNPVVRKVAVVTSEFCHKRPWADDLPIGLRLAAVSEKPKTAGHSIDYTRRKGVMLLTT
jgi:hypothetical protein